MTPHWTYYDALPENRWSLFWRRVGAALILIGLLCIGLVVIGAPLVAAIYHAIN